MQYNKDLHSSQYQSFAAQLANHTPQEINER